MVDKGGGEWNLDREVRCISMMSRNVANRGSAVILSNLSIDFQFRERARVRSRRTRLLAIFARRSAANEGKAICTRIHAHAHTYTHTHTNARAHTTFLHAISLVGEKCCHEKCPYSIQHDTTRE